MNQLETREKDQISRTFSWADPDALGIIVYTASTLYLLLFIERDCRQPFSSL